MTLPEPLYEITAYQFLEIIRELGLIEGDIYNRKDDLFKNLRIKMNDHLDTVITPTKIFTEKVRITKGLFEANEDVSKEKIRTAAIHIIMKMDQTSFDSLFSPKITKATDDDIVQAVMMGDMDEAKELVDLKRREIYQISLKLEI